MEENGGSKVAKIRQIIKIKQYINKWQSVTLGKNNNRSDTAGSGSNGSGGISPAIIRRLKGSNNNNNNNNNNNGRYDSDDDSICQSPEPPFDVPKGYLAVYVGTDEDHQHHRRFIIPTCYLTSPLFKVLLEKVEEEFGYDLTGGLTIPCEIETFKYLLQCIDSHHKQHLNDHNSGNIYILF